MQSTVRRFFLVGLVVLAPAAEVSAPAAHRMATPATAEYGPRATPSEGLAGPPGPCRGGYRGMQLPVDSEVVDRFRPPATKFGPGNRGWEFGTGGGERVCAVGSGVVSFAGPVAGRGVVSILHDGGLRSSVTGLDTVEVSAGTEIVGGTPIGTASPGMHLGFRLDGEYVDPAAVFGLATHAVLVPLPAP